MLRVERADVDRLREIRAEWNGLVAAMARPSTFSTWEWIEAWWRHFGDAYEPVLLHFYRGETLVGILPLASRWMIVEDAALPTRTLLYCGSRELGSDHIDLIASASDAAECLAAAGTYLQWEFRDWDLLHFSHVAEDSRLLEWAEGNTVPFPVDSRVVSAAPYVDLSVGFDSYRMSLRKKKRKHLEGLAGQLFGGMGVEYWKCDPVEAKNAVRQLFDLHRLRAASLKRATVFKGERLIRFHEDIAVRLQQQGQLRLRFLRQRGVPLSAWYCFECHGRAFAYQTGMDPAWEKYGAGNLLLYEVIRESSEEGLKEVDLLRGGHYKGRWTKRSRALSTINMYNDTALARLARWGARWRTDFVHAVKQRSRRPTPQNREGEIAPEEM